MNVFFTNYHISVNGCLVHDLLSIGHNVIMPSTEMARGRISFFAPNDEHRGKAIFSSASQVVSRSDVRIVNYHEYLDMEPMAMIIPCDQLYADMMRLYEARGKKDVIVYLPALSTSTDTFPLDGSDFVIGHDLAFFRQCKAKYKILYFNQPNVLDVGEKDIEKTYRERKIKLYINNFFDLRFEPERTRAEQFEKLWGSKIPMYGYGNPDGWPSMMDVQKHMVDSMFSLVFKRPETWGQMVNESMQHSTPVVMLREFMQYGNFRDYLLTYDNAIIGDTVEELIARINSLSLEQYETMCFEAKQMSKLFCEDTNRQEKLAWLFDKVYGKLESIG